MPDLALVSTTAVSIVESFVQHTAPAGANVTAGQTVMLDPATGRFIVATGGATSRVYGIAGRTAAAGQPLTAIRKGVMDGYVLDALAFDAPLYTSAAAGAIQEVATGQTLIGRVIAGYYNVAGRPHDKLLFIDL